MMAAVPHVTSGSGLRKFQADGFLFDRVYIYDAVCFTCIIISSLVGRRVRSIPSIKHTRLPKIKK